MNILPIISLLTDQLQRERAITELTAYFKAQDIMIFVKDPDIDVLLPAPGFLQTLPVGQKWKNFLHKCSQQDYYTGTLPSLKDRSPVKSIGISNKQRNIVFIILGTQLIKEELQFIDDLLPILQKIFHCEQNTLNNKALLQSAEKSLMEVHDMAIKLDTVRKDLQAVLKEKEEEMLVRIRSEQALKENEEHLRFLVDASAVFSSSLNYKTTLTNVAKMAIQGFTDWCIVYISDENGDINRLTLEAADPKTKDTKIKIKQEFKINPKAKQGVPYVIKTGKPLLYEKATHEILTSDVYNPESLLTIVSKLTITSWICVPLRVRKNIFGAISFITKEKKYTKKDLILAQELSYRASLAIENARLYSEAQKAIKLRDEFISIASHELKTPVTSLKIYGQLLERKYSSPENNELTYYVTKMNFQTGRLVQLIGDLLNVSQIQKGKLDFKIERFNLTHIVAEVLEIMKTMYDQHSISLHNTLTKQVIGDPERISQVIINLVTNAIKYSPKSTKVDVFLEEGQEVGIVTVKDYGMGIAKSEQRKIFNRFYRADSDEGVKISGLGIGLYISNEIIKRHGGNISVKSIKGKGSTFCFTLPLADNEN